MEGFPPPPPGGMADHEQMLEEKVRWHASLSHGSVLQFWLFIELITPCKWQNNSHNSSGIFAGEKMAANEHQAICEQAQIWLCSSTKGGHAPW